MTESHDPPPSVTFTFPRTALPWLLVALLAFLLGLERRDGSAQQVLDGGPPCQVIPQPASGTPAQD